MRIKLLSLAIIMYPLYSKDISLPIAIPWHTSFPSLGLHQNTSVAQYPFLPHLFTLTQLAPSQGGFIKLVLIDTGLDEYHYKHMLASLKKAQPALEPSSFNNFICDTTDKPFLTFNDIPLSFQSLYKASHATHMYSLITGKHGIAPKALCIVLKTFNAQGISTQKNLLHALTIAKKIDPDIVLIGLKFHDSCNPEAPLARTLNSHLSSFPYVVAAAGNDGLVSQQLAYPARFASTTFSVGAFSYKHNKCFVAPFSQAEPNVGPSFLLPGTHIQGAFITNFSNYTYYDFMSGTSCAAALYAGYLALVLAEFKEHFTQEQITKTLRLSCFYPDTNPTWKKSALYGIPDLRLGLFLLHLLRYIKPSLPNFALNFNFILESCHKYLMHHTDSCHFLASSNTATLACSLPHFNQDFISYLSISTSQFKLGIRHPYLVEFSSIFNTTNTNHQAAHGLLNKALEYCASSLIAHLRTHLSNF